MKEVLLREEKRKKEEADEKRRQRALDDQLAITQKKVQESLQKQADQLTLLEHERSAELQQRHSEFQEYRRRKDTHKGLTIIDSS